MYHNAAVFNIMLYLATLHWPLTLRTCGLIYDALFFTIQSNIVLTESNLSKILTEDKAQLTCDAIYGCLFLNPIWSHLWMPYMYFLWIQIWSMPFHCNCNIVCHVRLYLTMIQWYLITLANCRNWMWYTDAYISGLLCSLPGYAT